MDAPSGRVVTLTAAGYVAEVVEVGAGLRALRHGGLDVVAAGPVDEMPIAGSGQILMPWPNRIQDGSYSFGGVSYQLALTEPTRHNASHGLVRWVNFHLDESSASQAVWSYVLPPQSGYPFKLGLAVTYDLAADGLHVTMTGTNLGDRPAPFGAGAHPYLTVGRRVDECELTVPAAVRCSADERGLPGPAEAVDGTDGDFRVARLVGSIRLDHPYGGLAYDGGEAQAVLRDPDSGREVRLTVDESVRWLQVYSGDARPSGARLSMAVEPMTCPPNAFKTGSDLVTLVPGATHTVRFRIT